jgi:hypothetical protein
MRIVPDVGDVIPLETGDATIIDVRDYHGFIKVLAARAQEIHPFAIWQWENGSLFSGKYFRTLKEAEMEWGSS